MVDCPYCGEEISADAVKCKHCDEFLRDGLREASARGGSSTNTVIVIVAVLMLLACGAVGFFAVLPSGTTPVPPPEQPPGLQLPPEVSGAALLPGRGLYVEADEVQAAFQTSGGDVIIRVQANAYLVLEPTSKHQALLSKHRVQHERTAEGLVVFGDAAKDLAELLGREVRVPFPDGLASQGQEQGLRIVELGVLQRAEFPREVVYYTAPSPPVDRPRDLEGHGRTLERTLIGLGYVPKPIAPGLAVVFGELDMADFSGIAIHVGAASSDVMVCFQTQPVLAFSCSKGSAWIAERMGAARDPEQAYENAYRELAEALLGLIVERWDSDWKPFAAPVELVLAGLGLRPDVGPLFASQLDRSTFPIPVRGVRVADDPNTSCVRGALVAAAAD